MYVLPVCHRKEPFSEASLPLALSTGLMKAGYLGVLAVELADPGDPTVYTGVLQHVLQAAHLPVFIRVLR